MNIGHTQDNPWYIGIEGGYSYLGSKKSVGDTLELITKFKDGHTFGGVVGYDYGDYRIEGEIGKHLHNADRFEIINDGGLGLGDLGIQNANSGRSNLTHFMMNIIYDLEKMANFNMAEPFIGTGIGFSKVKWSNMATSTGTISNDSDSVFSYQIFAGLRFDVSSDIEMAVKYRYFKSIDVDMVDRLNNAYDTSYGTHDFLVSLNYRFGLGGTKKTPRVLTGAIPTPAPAEEPEPLVEIHIPEPIIIKDVIYKIYYDWDSAEISEAGQVTIEKAATDAKKGNNITIELDGHADRSGPEKYNLALSLKRAEIVKVALVSEGIDHSTISIEAHGESSPEVETDDGIRERRNRRVVILIK